MDKNMLPHQFLFFYQIWILLYGNLKNKFESANCHIINVVMSKYD
jgi:hypothetical protein